MRRIFLIALLLSFLSFPIALLLVPELHVHSALLHMMILSLAMLGLWKGDAASTLRSIGLPGNHRRTLIYTFLGLCAFFLTLLALAFISVWFGFADQHKVAQKVNDLPVHLLIFAIVVAPISEELFFRAFLIERMKDMLSPYLGHGLPALAAILLSSLLFGILHMGYGSMVEIVGAGLMGAVLGAVYVRSGSIAPPMLMHFLYNLASITYLRMFL